MAEAAALVTNDGEAGVAELISNIQSITANFTGVTRNDRMGGREYLVAPMIMILEGVHEGSQGPLLYPAEELKEFPSAWNAKPVVVYHPIRNGAGVSACDPDVITNRGVGLIMNTRFEDGKLKAEAWIDLERAAIVDDRVVEAIQKNQVMEVSTGLFTENERTEGDWNGEHYEAIARNYRPDHLALLPDIEGACSIEDGAGFLRLNQAGDGLVVDISEMEEVERTWLKSNKGTILRTASTILKNAISHSNVWSALSSILMDRNEDAWIDEVFDDFYIYRVDGKLFRQAYTKVDDKVEVAGNIEEVVRVVEFRKLDGTVIGNKNKRKDNSMDKTKLVDGLIANVTTQWTEDDRDALMNMDEATLTKMIPVQNDEEQGTTEEARTNEASSEETSEEPTDNITVDQYIEKAPGELQGVLRNGLKSYNAEKASLIGIITTNAKNTFSKEQLEAKDVVELKSLAALAATTKEAQESVNNYVGQGDGAGETPHKEEPLALNTLGDDIAKEDES